MCKVLMIAGIKSENVSKVHELAKVAAKNMSAIEDDGVGYAAITTDGQIYGEKWLKKDTAFQIHAQPKPDALAQAIQHMFGGMGEFVETTITEQIYASFGKRSLENVGNTVAMILHARKASTGSPKTIQNVHPFVSLDVADQPDTALIHNGNILNHEKLTKITSSCDSETILHEYLGNMMYHNPWGIEQVAKTLVGEYACGVLSSMTDTDGAIIPVLDIFKSGKELYAGYVQELETMVFCTSDYVLKSSCEEVGLKVSNILKLKDGYLMRLNAVTGARMEDLISFSTSPKFYRQDYSTNHQYSMHKPRVVEPIVEDDSIESAKKHFTRKHPALFTLPYVEVGGKLLQHEQTLYKELAKSETTNHKALHLVNVGLNAMASRA